MNNQMISFLDAIDKLIAVIKAELREREIQYSGNQLDRRQLKNCKSPPMDCLLNYNFPMFTPHRNLIFIDAKRQFGEYVVFANDPTYNNFYALDIQCNSRIVAIDQESGSVVHSCARDFNSFLSAFAVLINRDVASRTNQESLRENWVERAVAEAGGAEYQPFYEFVIA